MLIRLAFGASLCVALLLLTLQFFLSPLYLEVEYDYPGFPPPRPLSDDERYTASQAFLSYLNVENGGATLLSLGELRFGAQPFFNEDDLACIFRAKELRGTAFGLTFAAGVAAIALGLFMAADDFTKARRTVVAGAVGAFFACTLLSVLARFFFPAIAPLLRSLMAAETCDPGATGSLALIFPPAIFQDGLVLLALFTRFAAAAVALAAWLFGRLALVKPGPGDTPKR
jgi:hypothetical protein